jgi:hypothetical protein
MSKPRTLDGKKDGPPQPVGPANDPPGTFYNGKRVLTPSGKAMPQSRPVSQLAARLRGVCAGTIEDEFAALTPLAVCCGSPTLARQQLNSRGRCISQPPGTHQAPLTSKVQRPVEPPNLESLSDFFELSSKLTNLPSTGSLQVSERINLQKVKEAFPTDGTALRDAWQRKILAAESAPILDPVVACGIENITEQSQVNRAATLLKGLLDFSRKVDLGQYPVVIEAKELVRLEPLHRMFRHTKRYTPNHRAFPAHLSGRGSASLNRTADGPLAAVSRPGSGKVSGSSTRPTTASSDGTPAPPTSYSANLHYHEGSRHIIVSRGAHLFHMEVIEPGGRVLESSEIKARLEQIQREADECPPTCEYDFTRLAKLNLPSFLEEREEIAAECASNAQCVEELESAILYLELSRDGSRTCEEAGFASPGEGHAWWPGACVSLHVYPNGNAILQGSSLVCDSSLLGAAASSIYNDANCDPMMEFIPPAPIVLQTMKLQARSTTPSTTKKGPPAKGGKQEEEPVLTPVTITIPPPEPAAPPRRLPLWMPREFCRRPRTLRAVPPFGCRNFSLQLHNEGTLYLATLFALKHRQPHRFPLVHQFAHSASRDPTLNLIVSNPIESALRHVTTFEETCGPFRTEVERVCGLAIQSLRPALTATRAPSNVSDFARLLSLQLLQPIHANDVAEGSIFGVADLVMTKIVHPDSLMWSARSPTWADPSGAHALLQSGDDEGRGQTLKIPPMLSYSISAGGRSSLRASLGNLVECSISYLPNDPLGAEVDEFIQNLLVFAKFLDSCCRKVRLA